MSIKVIGSGLGRTGTHSLKLALELIGFNKCYHMFELFQHPEGLKYFKLAEKGERVNWDELFEGYLSAVDYPVSRYYKQISEYYPDAKIIHTVRDPESWYKSASETIFWVTKPSLFKKLKVLLKLPFSSSLRRIFPIMKFNSTLLDNEFGNDLTNKAEVIRRYNEHNKKVLASVPKERLLVFKSADGWEPLCKFLNVPVPDTPFPHSNTTEDFINKVTSVR